MLFRLFLAIALSTAPLAWAQVPTPENSACDNMRGDVAPAAQEDACSAVIQRGGPNDSLALAYSNRGQSFLRRRAYEKAIEDYDQAIALDPRLVAAYRNRGAAYFTSERYDRALPDYEATIRLQPDEPRGYADRCSVHVMTDKPKDAIVDCDKAIDLDSLYGPAHAWRALAQLQLGNISAAAEDVTAIAHEYATDSSVRYLQGMVLEAKGEKTEAAAQYRAARELSAEDFARLDRIYGRFRRR